VVAGAVFTSLPTLDADETCVRPEAVNISNVSNLVDAESKPHFKYVIEGANLFFTQQARFWLEKKGVVLFKDSSTNKVGGALLILHLTSD